MSGLLARLALAAWLAAAAAGAQAGRPCEPAPLAPRDVARAMELAHRTRDALEHSGAQAALVGRVGQDLSRYGQRYSHLGLAWRDHPKGRWFVVHELNECGSAASALYDEGLGNFFLDNLHAYEAVLVLPDDATQARLAAVLAGRLPQGLHEPRYNMLAYAWGTQYQNSNQWLLEVLAAAAADRPDLRTRAQAQAWLREAGYRPDVVRLDSVTRLGARMFRANVAFDDHPFGPRMAGQISTVTVDSVVRFVAGRRQGRVQVVGLD